jgi:hypothetical protein
MRTLPINYALHGETEIHKIKETSKIKDKQTSIAAVRDQFLSFATFLTPLLSRYRPHENIDLKKGVSLSQRQSLAPNSDSQTS